MYLGSRFHSSTYTHPHTFQKSCLPPFSSGCSLQNRQECNCEGQGTWPLNLLRWGVSVLEIREMSSPLLDFYYFHCTTNRQNYCHQMRFWVRKCIKEMLAALPRPISWIKVKGVGIQGKGRKRRGRDPPYFPTLNCTLLLHSSQSATKEC